VKLFRRRNRRTGDANLPSRVIRGPDDDPTLTDEEILERRQAWFAAYIDHIQNSSVIEGPEGGPYRCPCCRHLTLPERGGYDICPVCFWEDDGQDDQDANVVRGGPNGRLSLTQARVNFAHIGASEERVLPMVRPPTPDEL
jgi:hypothetical protein